MAATKREAKTKEDVFDDGFKCGEVAGRKSYQQLRRKYTYDTDRMKEEIAELRSTVAELRITISRMEYLKAKRSSKLQK